MSIVEMAATMPTDVEVAPLLEQLMLLVDEERDVRMGFKVREGLL